jgi:hypothetical protein
MALEKINTNRADPLYYSKKTGKYKADLSRFGLSKKVTEVSITPSVKSIRRHQMSKKEALAKAKK